MEVIPAFSWLADKARQGPQGIRNPELCLKARFTSAVYRLPTPIPALSPPESKPIESCKLKIRKGQGFTEVCLVADGANFAA